MTRSTLYAPGDRPERFDNAASCGADAIILDLEDGVALANKDLARGHVAEWLSANLHRDVLVRINSVDDQRAADLATVRAAGGTRVVVPKATPEACDLDGLDVVALIETAEGVARLHEIAALPCVVRLAVGEADLGESLGMWPSADGREFAPIRSQIVVASARAGLDAPVGPVPVELDDLDGLEASSATLRRQGFGGRSVIHPKQVAAVNAAFSPSSSEVEWARGVVDASAHADGNVAVHEGGFVDAPILARAHRILQFGERR